jgi:RNA polymerase sigma-70 factor (ECF subfamily)
VTDPIVSRNREHSPSTSMSLLEKAIVGDREAWERIVYLYSPLVDRWCRRRRLNEDEIRDVGQIVFMTLYTNIWRFCKKQPGDSFRKWLKTLTGNKVTDHLRKNRDAPHAQGGSEARALFEAHAFEASATVPDADESESERKLLLHRCLEMVKSEFEARTFTAFWEVVVNEKCPAEIAGSLGFKSVGAVYTAKARVIKRLRELLDQLEEDLPVL